jgi:hypothetical protein
MPCGPVWGENGAWDAYTANAFSSKDGTRQFVLGVSNPPSDSLTEAIFALATKALCGREVTESGEPTARPSGRAAQHVRRTSTLSCS